MVNNEFITKCPSCGGKRRRWISNDSAECMNCGQLYKVFKEIKDKKDGM